MNSNYKNRLSHAVSPYLRQHASNPVNWYEWGPEALKRATFENKPLIVSIGYAACHWCHVMAHESFSNTEVADYMNAHFINIKIDREERPDIDQVYMDAVHLTGGQGGWPLNAITMPDGKPFFVGTYFQPAQWLALLQKVVALYQNDFQRVQQISENIAQGIRNAGLIASSPESKDFEYKKVCNQLANEMLKMVDFDKGGFAGVPKFMMPVAWNFLLNYYNPQAPDAVTQSVETTLIAMARGGLYDQIGGGFARYSTDVNWHVPHFEKMLYDNAQLISLYARTYSISKNEFLRLKTVETIAFCERELSNAENGFYASIDADSEGVEGKFYVWTKAELWGLLGEPLAGMVCDFYNVSAEGNWEFGQNILVETVDVPSLAAKYNVSTDVFVEAINAARSKMLALRNLRVHPETDDKIITAWNGLMIAAYVDAYLAFNNAAYLGSAKKLADFVLEQLVDDDGRLMRCFRDGTVSSSAFLDDYACLIKGLLAVYEACFDTRYLGEARRLIEIVKREFADEFSPLFYYTSTRAEELFARKKEVSDHVIPSSNSVLAMALYRIGLIEDRFEDVALAKQMFGVVASEIAGGGPYYANWAGLGFALMQGETVVTFSGGDNYTENRMALGSKAFAVFRAGMADIPQIEVCRFGTCALPVQTITDAEALLNVAYE